MVRTLEPIINGKLRPQFGWRFVIYSIYAWGIPLFIVLVGQILDWIEVGTDDETVRPQFGFLKCWFMCKSIHIIDNENILFKLNYVLYQARSRF